MKKLIFVFCFLVFLFLFFVVVHKFFLTSYYKTFCNNDDCITVVKYYKDRGIGAEPYNLILPGKDNRAWFWPKENVLIIEPSDIAVIRQDNRFLVFANGGKVLFDGLDFEFVDVTTLKNHIFWRRFNNTNHVVLIHGMTAY